MFSRTAISNYQTMHVTSSTSLPMNPQKAAFGLFRDSRDKADVCAEGRFREGTESATNRGCRGVFISLASHAPVVPYSDKHAHEVAMGASHLKAIRESNERANRHPHPGGKDWRG